jgi:hypothetical protein
LQGFDLVYEGVGGRIGNIARRLLAALDESHHAIPHVPVTLFHRDSP